MPSPYQRSPLSVTVPYGLGPQLLQVPELFRVSVKMSSALAESQAALATAVSVAKPKTTLFDKIILAPKFRGDTLCSIR
jgi:hypothetical protein